MNWRDSIWVQDSGTPKRSTQCLVPYSENMGYASNPRRFRYLYIAKLCESLGLVLNLKMNLESICSEVF